MSSEDTATDCMRDQLITAIGKLLQEEYCERAKEYLVACYLEDNKASCGMNYTSIHFTHFM